MPTRKLRHVRLLVFVPVLALALMSTACSKDKEPSTAEVPGDVKGTITVYSGRSEELVGPAIKKFETATGVDVKVRYGDTAELAATISEEGKRSPADVFWAQDAGALGAVAKGGLFARLSDEINDLVEPKFYSSKGEWVGITGRARVAVYNPDMVKAEELPASVEGLTESQWKGKIGWAPTNGSFQAFVTAMRVLKGDDYARTWLEGIRANSPKSYPNNDALTLAVSKGEVALGLVNHYYLLEMSAEDPSLKGALHFFKGGDVGSLVNVAGAGVLKSSDNPDAAEVFIKFMLSKSSQQYFAEKVWEYPLIQGVEAHESLPKLDEIESPDIDLSQLADLQGTLDLLKETGVL